MLVQFHACLSQSFRFRITFGRTFNCTPRGFHRLSTRSNNAQITHNNHTKKDGTKTRVSNAVTECTLDERGSSEHIFCLPAKLINGPRPEHLTADCMFVVCFRGANMTAARHNKSLLAFCVRTAFEIVGLLHWHRDMWIMVTVLSVCGESEMAVHVL